MRALLYPAMRRLFLLVLGSALALVAASGASARTITAGELARECNKDGQVTVLYTLKVVGGSGVLTRNCFITMAKKARLELHRATLRRGNVSFVISDARAFASVYVDHSRIALGSGDALQLSPGCCEGEDAPAGSERNATVEVYWSTLRAGAVEVSGSTAAPNGTSIVRHSTLRGTATWSDNPVTVAASLGDSGG